MARGCLRFHGIVKSPTWLVGEETSRTSLCNDLATYPSVTRLVKAASGEGSGKREVITPQSPGTDGEHGVRPGVEEGCKRHMDRDPRHGKRWFLHWVTHSHVSTPCLAAPSLHHCGLCREVEMLLAPAGPFPFPPEHHFSAGLWDRVLFLRTPCSRESHKGFLLV